MPSSLRRIPRQDRSRQLVDAIVEGAARLLERKDDDGVTTNAIANAAGVSIGSLYQYFPGKEAVLRALVRRRMRETHEALLVEIEGARGLTLEEAVARVVDRILAMKAKTTRIDAAVFRQALRHGLTEEAFALDDELVRRFASVIEGWKPAVREDVDARVAAHLLFHGLRAVMVVGALGEPELTDSPAMRRELERLLVGYLTHPAGKRE
jgi:AcrR family transcriptional regulator